MAKKKKVVVPVDPLETAAKLIALIYPGATTHIDRGYPGVFFAEEGNKVFSNHWYPHKNEAQFLKLMDWLYSNFILYSSPKQDKSGFYLSVQAFPSGSKPKTYCGHSHDGTWVSVRSAHIALAEELANVLTSKDSDTEDDE